MELEIESSKMAYQEKVAWLSLIALAVAYAPYFAMVASGAAPKEPASGMHQLGMFAAAAISNAILIGVGHLVLKLKFPEDARIKPDERDRAITARSLTYAYYVLMTGMILVGCVMPFTNGTWAIVNAAVFMIVLAEVVHFTVAGVSYRRQA